MPSKQKFLFSKDGNDKYLLMKMTKLNIFLTIQMERTLIHRNDSQQYIDDLNSYF